MGDIAGWGSQGRASGEQDGRRWGKGRAGGWGEGRGEGWQKHEAKGQTCWLPPMMRMLPSPMVAKVTPTRVRSSEPTRVEVLLIGSTMRMAWAPAVRKSPFRLMLFPASYKRHA